MNPLTDLLFTFTWFALFVVAVRSIIRGWQIGSENSSPMSISEARRTVTKAIHPEMRDVKQGDELMVVNFGSKACDIEEYNQLQERIKELQSKLEDSIDDDDDDGDVPALIKR